jgi:hypothetical protein
VLFGWDWSPLSLCNFAAVACTVVHIDRRFS